MHLLITSKLLSYCSVIELRSRWFSSTPKSSENFTTTHERTVTQIIIFMELFEWWVVKLGVFSMLSADILIFSFYFKIILLISYLCPNGLFLDQKFFVMEKFFWWHTFQSWCCNAAFGSAYEEFGNTKAIVFV